MYPFSLIDPPTLLLVSISVFTLTGVFMAIAARIRGERAYTWLALGALAFAGGWALNLSQWVYGLTIVTMPTAEILLLILPIFLLCATLDFLRLPGIPQTLAGAALLLGVVFWALVLFIDNKTVPGAMTSSLNGTLYLFVARLFFVHAYPNNAVGALIIGAIVVIGTAFILRTVFLMYGLVFTDSLGPDLRKEVLYAMLLIDLMGIFLLALCFPLFDFLRTETSLNHANAHLTHLAERDPLTGVYNRRVFFARLEGELARQRASGIPLSLILFDIDHFKLVNDSRGHAIGDQVLKHVVGIAHQRLRASDLLTRFGGEEFILLLPGTPLDGAALVAERIRLALDVTPAPIPAQLGDGQPLRVTCSFGVTATNGQTDSVEDLLGAVDRAMYAAKHQGRNRVYTCCGDAEPTHSLPLGTPSPA